MRKHAVYSIAVIALICMMSTGCLFVPVAAIVASSGGAYLKYKGMDAEAEALRGAVIQLEELNKTLRDEKEGD